MEVAAMAGSNRCEEFLQDENVFRRCAARLIKEMVFLSAETVEDTTPLVDEILHSIFFLGRIYDPQFSPTDIEIDPEMLEFLADYYPEPFRRYSSQLPKRAPFSCVLDMIVSMVGQENEDEIKNQLEQLVQRLHGDTSKELLSTTMCISQILSPPSVRYYGVSMSTSGKAAGKIMVAASILHTWHPLVAGAVLSYDQTQRTRPLRGYFNGTVRLPGDVRCEAYNISDQRAKLPCRACRNLFGFNNAEEKESRWAYGNCAEVESVSKLFTHETEVTEQVQFQSEHSAEGRQRAEKEVCKELKHLLKARGYKWDNNSYVPQSIMPLEENDTETS